MGQANDVIYFSRKEVGVQANPYNLPPFKATGCDRYSLPARQLCLGAQFGQANWVECCFLPQLPAQKPVQQSDFKSIMWDTFKDFLHP